MIKVSEVILSLIDVVVTYIGRGGGGVRRTREIREEGKTAACSDHQRSEKS